MFKAQGRALPGLIASQVGQGQHARVARVLLHLVNDGLGDFTFMQRPRALFCQASEHGAEFGILQHMALGPGFALAVIKILGSDRVPT